MNDKETLITMLAKADISFNSEKNRVSFSTSNNGDLTSFHFDDDGKLLKTSCNA